MFPQLLSVFFALTPDLAYSAVTNDSPQTSWFPPKESAVSSLSSAINGTGTYGFIFNSSQTPLSLPYSTYNWCNMPHVRPAEYKTADAEYSLRYVEVIHRHHKRTPYASNAFPVEAEPWSCADTALFYSGSPLHPRGNSSAQGYWSVYTDPSNPFVAPGFPGDCQFPQLTREGLNDAWQHGKDLYAVYHDMLHFLPDSAPGRAPDGFSVRVTNNVITSQVAGMVLNGMFDITGPYPLMIQPSATDSLEPTYSCPAADALAQGYGVGSQDPNWTSHLEASASLVRRLDTISGVDPTSPDWHQSWDHYFDNLSARQCHGKALPCSLTSPSQCINQTDANEVFRLGEWEYSWLYRGASASLAFSTASYGVWVAELASHFRSITSDETKSSLFRHNVAHDGSLSRLLSILQLDVMVWPGMGAEVVFELYSNLSMEWFVRVLWGGQPLESSNPALGLMEMIPLTTLLEYFDDLVGPMAQQIPGKCREPAS